MAEEPTRHILVPKHTKLSEEEKNALFEKYDITARELPKIPQSDPALAGMTVKQGDVIRITRKSLTAGKTTFYRGVSSE
ncbi:MAG: DNA-directed RNA polymerase subunit H [Nanoarchaeota archaeon]